MESDDMNGYENNFVLLLLNTHFKTGGILTNLEKTSGNGKMACSMKIKFAKYVSFSKTFKNFCN